MSVIEWILHVAATVFAVLVGTVISRMHFWRHLEIRALRRKTGANGQWQTICTCGKTFGEIPP